MNSEINTEIKCWMDGLYSDNEIMHILKDFKVHYQLDEQKRDEDEQAG